MIEDLWADEAVGTARNVLQTKVSRLRRALGDAALVTGTSAGYTLEVDPRAVDALEVLSLAEEASALEALATRPLLWRRARRRWPCSRERSCPPRVMVTGSPRTALASGWRTGAFGECLLAAMDAADRESAAEERLVRTDAHTIRQIA